MEDPNVTMHQLTFGASHETPAARRTEKAVMQACLQQRSFTFAQQAISSFAYVNAFILVHFVVSNILYIQPSHLSDDSSIRIVQNIIPSKKGKSGEKSDN